MPPLEILKSAGFSFFQETPEKVFEFSIISWKPLENLRDLGACSARELSNTLVFFDGLNDPKLPWKTPEKILAFSNCKGVQTLIQIFLFLKNM